MIVLAAVLAFIIGFLCCAGAIVGVVYYAYGNVSLDKLREWNLVSVNVEEYVDYDAELAWSTATVSDLYQSIRSFKEGSSPSLDTLVTYYGVKLPEKTRTLLPAPVRTMPVGTLFSKEGLDRILDEVTLDYAWQFIPEDLLSAPAKETLAGKTLRQIIDLNLTGLLSGVKLGYLLGVDYVYDEATSLYSVVYGDPASPTLFELLAPLDLGDVLSSVKGEDDLLGVLRAQTGDIILTQLFASVGMKDNATVNCIFGDKLLSDLIVKKEDGGYKADFLPMVNGNSVGSLLGYTPQHLRASEDSPIIGWYDKDGAEVKGMMRGLCCATIRDLGTDEFSASALIDDLCFGDVLNLVPSAFDDEGNVIEWKNEDGTELSGINKKLADKKLSELTGEGGSFSTLLEGMTVGDVLGYEQIEDEWFDHGEKVTGINAIAAEIDLGKMTDPNEDYDISSIFGDRPVGEFLGWTKDEDGDWCDENGKTTGVMASFADLTIDELSDSQKVDDTVNGMLLGDVLGFTKGEDEKWYKDKDCTEKVTGIMKALAPKTVGELDSSIGGIEIGEVIGWTRGEDGKWYDKNNDLASGMLLSLADLTIDEMSDSEKISTAVKSMKIADVMGFTFTEGAWCDSTGQKLSGIMKAIAPMTVSEIETETGEIRISEILGWEKVGDKWFNEEGEEQTGVMCAFAGLTIDEMSDPDTVSGAVDDIVIGEAMGFTFTDGVWCDANGPVTGILGAIAGTQIGGLSEKINTLTVSDIFSEDEMNSGFLKLLDGDTKITELASATEEAFTSSSIGDLMDAGLLSLNETKMDLIFGSDVWRGYSIQEFLDSIIAKIPA